MIYSSGVRSLFLLYLGCGVLGNVAQAGKDYYDYKRFRNYRYLLQPKQGGITILLVVVVVVVYYLKE